MVSDTGSPSLTSPQLRLLLKLGIRSVALFDGHATLELRVTWLEGESYFALFSFLLSIYFFFYSNYSIHVLAWNAPLIFRVLSNTSFLIKRSGSRHQYLKVHRTFERILAQYAFNILQIRDVMTSLLNFRPMCPTMSQCFHLFCSLVSDFQDVESLAGRLHVLRNLYIKRMYKHRYVTYSWSPSGPLRPLRMRAQL